MEFIKKDNLLTIYLKGRLDSSNCDEIFIEINEIIKNNYCDVVCLDLIDLRYISSAGLRTILKFKKSCKELYLDNASNDVYDVFDMTGFISFIKVKKQLKTISIKDCPLIGEGYMGKVYRIDSDTIVKVFTRAESVKDIERERELAKKAFMLGIPTAISFEVVKIEEGGYGAIFEMLKSSGLNSLFKQYPEKENEYISMYCNLLKDILTTEVKDDDLPNKKDTARSWVKDLISKHAFEDNILEKISTLVETIPDDRHLIHGDYHPKNIMMQGDEPLLIDMDTLGMGHDIFEFTAFYLAYYGYPYTTPVPKDNEWFLGLTLELTDRIYKAAFNFIYGNRSLEEQKTIQEKIELLGYIWLTDKTLIYENDNLYRLNTCKNNVLKLIDKVDTLAY